MDAGPLFSFLTTAVQLNDGLVTHDISIWKILLTILLVLLNAFFVSAEFAIVKIRTSQIDTLADLRPKITKTARNIVDHLDAYLAATQLGVTLASLGLGWVGEGSISPIISKLLGLFGLHGPQWETVSSNIALWGAFAVITLLHIVFGELMPKSMAIRHPVNTTFSIAWPLKIFYTIFQPIIWLMNGFANSILKLIGITPVHGSEIHSEEELKMIISESEEGGAIEKTESDLIQNVFEFDDRRVSSIQTQRKNISAIDIDTTVKEVIDFVLEEGYSRYPVYEESLDNIIGILYTKDLMKLTFENPKEESFKKTLRKPLFVSENDLIKNLLKKFQMTRIQMAVVTDEIGEVTGIVSMEDILEELVGEIQDEYDNEEPIVIKIEENKYIVDAHSTISDINRYLPFKFEESDQYETFSGLMAETFPEKDFKMGDILQLEDYEVRVVRMFRNSIERAVLKVIEKPEEEETD